MGGYFNGVAAIVRDGFYYLMGHYAIMRHKHLNDLNQTLRVNELSQSMSLAKLVGID